MSLTQDFKKGCDSKVSYARKHSDPRLAGGGWSLGQHRLTTPAGNTGTQKVKAELSGSNRQAAEMESRLLTCFEEGAVFTLLLHVVHAVRQALKLRYTRNSRALLMRGPLSLDFAVQPEVGGKYSTWAYPLYTAPI